MTYLVTGAAGFIGFHLSKRLIIEGFQVVGIDNMSDYYDISIKKDRLKCLDEITINNSGQWTFLKGDLKDDEFLDNIFTSFNPTCVINLAAQAGVRYSLDNPKIYLESNIVGFGNILECCKNFNVKNLIYASSSSVYGGNSLIPFDEKHSVDHPVSLYAATKRSNELMAHTYSHLYGICSTGLRFFTVYGPWGRPDMAPMKFVNAILNRKPMEIFNHGDMARDFTYIEDVVEIIFRLINKPAYSDYNFDKDNPNPSRSWSPHRIFNIANGKKVTLMKFINLLEEELGMPAIKQFKEMQRGDVQYTAANNKAIRDWVEYEPLIDIGSGIKKFVEWYRQYYAEKNYL